MDLNVKKVVETGGNNNGSAFEQSVRYDGDDELSENSLIIAEDEEDAPAASSAVETTAETKIGCRCVTKGVVFWFCLSFVRTNCF